MNEATKQPPVGALAGVHVLDFTRFQQGPFATVLLADMGADVIKIEQPGGDPGRAIGLHQDGYSSYFESLNRNKRSLSLDLRRPEARALILRLVESMDIVTENFSPGTMERLGLGYDELSLINPALIFASGSMYGPHGPRAQQRGYDTIAQAAGGLMAWTTPSGEMPRGVQSGLADQTSGMFLAIGILGALAHRLRTGEGQKVDVSLYGAQISLQAIHYARALHHTPLMPPGKSSGVFSHVAMCGDGRWIVFGMLEGRLFPRLCQALDCAELADDPRFVNAEARAANMGRLIELLDVQLIQRSSDEWAERLAANDLSGSVVQDYAMVAEDEQAQLNGLVHESEHPTWGRIRTQGDAMQLSRTPATVRTPAPERPGADSREVLAELGLSEQGIAALAACGTLVDAQPSPSGAASG